MVGQNGRSLRIVSCIDDVYSVVRFLGIVTVLVKLNSQLKYSNPSCYVPVFHVRAVILSIFGDVCFRQKIMDAEDLFRKLTSGAKFNFKKYSTDAQKLKVCMVFVTVILYKILV